MIRGIFVRYFRISIHGHVIVRCAFEGEVRRAIVKSEIFFFEKVTTKNDVIVVYMRYDVAR